MTDQQTDKLQEHQTLSELHQKIGEYLYCEDNNTIDLLLATAISRTQKEAKLWLIVVGKSGDGKTELLKLFENQETTYTIKNLTVNTFVNGKGNKRKYEDLAPKLKDKIILIPEMAQILKLRPEDKASIMAQLRDLYDGEAGKDSAESSSRYTDLNVTLIGCSTPAIDSQIMIHQDLGTRELLYRTKDKDEEKLISRVVQNTEIDREKARQELKEAVQQFIKKHPYKHKKLEDIKPETMKQIEGWAKTTALMRTTASIDYATGEIDTFSYPEQPTRIVQQFLTLYRALKSLDESFTDEQAIKLISEIAVSSCKQERIRTLMHMITTAYYDTEWANRQAVADRLRINPKTAYAELNLLHQLDMMEKETTLIDEQRGRYLAKFRTNWKNPTVRHIAEHFQIKREALAAIS